MTRTQMYEMIEISGSMEKTINIGALRSFLEVVKVDHLVWKLEVYKVFMGVSTKGASDFADHTVCRLGKWYYDGEGKKSFSSLPGFKKIEQPHKDVHTHGLEALNQFKLGESTKALEYLGHMEKASMKVLAALSALSENV